MQYNCITNEVHVVAPFRRSFECNTTLFDEVTALYGNGCVCWSTKQALGDVLSLLEAEFADAEREFQHTDVNTDQEDDTEEQEEDTSTEKNSDEEDGHDLAHG